MAVRGSAMESATILMNLTGIPSGPVDVSDLNNFSMRRTSPWDTFRSLKLAGLSSGRDSISSSRQKGKSLLTGKVLSAVQAKNEFNLLGSCPKGCWLGFNMRWIIRHTSFGLLEENACLVKVSQAWRITAFNLFLTSRKSSQDSWEPVWWASFLSLFRSCCSAPSEERHCSRDSPWTYC